jgi:hypothetical protein
MIRNSGSESAEKNAAEIKDVISTHQLEANAEQHGDIHPGISILRANDLQPETRALLGKEDPRLLDGNAIIQDNTGRLAEKYAQIVLKNEGLPLDGGRTRLKDVSDLKTSSAGIDLIGVEETASHNGTAERVPMLIEVKKRTAVDDLGKDRITHLEPETKELIQRIQGERSKDIFTQQRVDERLAQAQREFPNQPARWNDYDEELSTLQMGGMWARDRWITILKDPAAVEQLRQSGVSERFLSLDNFRDPYSSEWQAILDRRKIVVVTRASDAASLNVTRDAVFRRHADVIGLTVV